jgi:hypothetical protein
MDKSAFFLLGPYELFCKTVGDVGDAERQIVALAMLRASFFLGKDFEGFVFGAHGGMATVKHSVATDRGNFPERDLNEAAGPALRMGARKTATARRMPMGLFPDCPSSRSYRRRACQRPTNAYKHTFAITLFCLLNSCVIWDR